MTIIPTDEEKRRVFRNLRWDGDGQLVDHGIHGKHNDDSLASIGLDFFGNQLAERRDGME